MQSVRVEEAGRTATLIDGWTTGYDPDHYAYGLVAAVFLFNPLVADGEVVDPGFYRIGVWQTCVDGYARNSEVVLPNTSEIHWLGDTYDNYQQANSARYDIGHNMALGFALGLKYARQRITASAAYDDSDI